jgi:hypothetical protein
MARWPARAPTLYMGQGRAPAGARPWRVPPEARAGRARPMAGAPGARAGRRAGYGTPRRALRCARRLARTCAVCVEKKQCMLSRPVRPAHASLTMMALHNRSPETSKQTARERTSRRLTEAILTALSGEPGSSHDVDCVLEAFGWLVEEHRVLSLFALECGRVPIRNSSSAGPEEATVALRRFAKRSETVHV